MKITVPVLRDPGSAPELKDRLQDLLPKFVSWLISFIIVCKFWLNHNHILGLALIRGAFMPGRYRYVDGSSVLTPRGGRFVDYEERDGLLIPLKGEVEWVLPEYPQTYWRGRITEISFCYD